MEGQVIVGIVTAVLVFLGTWLIFRGTRGKTQSDYRTAMEARIDKKVEEYTKTVEARAEKYEKQNTELSSKYEDLSVKYDDLDREQKFSMRRETRLYQYILELRNHVVMQLPPPPPDIPADLAGWFEDLEGTYPPLT